ncbi:matrix metalloproteinase-20-like [Macrosteles quadrilineatus]|uniref:matrix metalloproteinase-20-like n=1 Tax=Macrosteles quadrilineatus TaxID=74068 RepID=UPI0023E093E9|nr:matrix metalloproteinase-20-like [Macrosteles quadrilineatus]
MRTFNKFVFFTTYAVLVFTGYSAAISSGPTSYLAQYGYLPPDDPEGPRSIISDDKFSNAIRDFQKFMGLTVTGELDDETKEQMAKPRCGVKDKSPPNPDGLSSYELGGSRWKVRTLSYKISKYSTRYPRGETDRAIRKAFNLWSNVTPLRFIRKRRGPVHFDIRFEQGKHYNGDDPCVKFDGRFGTLAHAYSPINRGRIHFDDAENWNKDSESGVNFLQAAAHEIGHALGLEHSDIKSALMFPTSSYQPNVQLHQDDITAIQRLYPN